MAKRVKPARHIALLKPYVKEDERRDGVFAQAKPAELALGAPGKTLAQRKGELAASHTSNGPPTRPTRTMTAMRLVQWCNGVNRRRYERAL
jgi:hypothetical protein